VTYDGYGELGPYGYGCVGGGGGSNYLSVPQGIAAQPWDGSSYENAVRDVTTYAATGYKRTRPGNPVASLGQFVIELRDLPSVPFRKAFSKGFKYRNSTGKFPSGVHTYPLNEIPGRLLSQLTNFRSLGSEYLNVVFGWKPFVNDLRKMYNLWQTIDKRIAQLVRENGKSINRRATLEQDTSTVDGDPDSYPLPYVWVTGGPSGVFPFIPGHSTWSGQRTTTTKVWYAANYRYYVPDIGSSQWDRRARLALFGALPTPELLYEVLPWSWLVDWFSNVGDVISNMSSNAVDNLVQNYAYTMKHVKVQTSLASTSYHPASSPGSSAHWPEKHVNATSIYTVETKLRDGTGNPFGLNVKLSSLSTYQLSILAALGISRSKVR